AAVAPAAPLASTAQSAVAVASGAEGAGEAALVPAEPPAEAPDKAEKELKIRAEAGWNRFIWDLRYPPVTKVEGSDPPSELEILGPRVVPGTYQVALTIGEQSYTQSFEVVKEPAIAASQEDLQTQFDLLTQIHQQTDTMVKAINRMRDLRQQLDGWRKRAA